MTRTITDVLSDLRDRAVQEKDGVTFGALRVEAGRPGPQPHELVRVAARSTRYGEPGSAVRGWARPW